jgi:hypothetical protein
MTAETRPQTDLGRLPTPGPHFVGREAELTRLDQAWEDPGTHVLTLVSVGKSALVAHWLDRMAADGWRGAERVLDWSFYSQGTEDRVTSAEPSWIMPSDSSANPSPKPAYRTAAASASPSSSERSACCSLSTVSSPCNTRQVTWKAVSKIPASPLC